LTTENHLDWGDSFDMATVSGFIGDALDEVGGFHDDISDAYIEFYDRF